MAAGNFHVSAWTRGCRNLGDDIFGLCSIYHWFLQGRESYTAEGQKEGYQCIQGIACIVSFSSYPLLLCKPRQWLLLNPMNL